MSRRRRQRIGERTFRKWLHRNPWILWQVYTLALWYRARRPSALRVWIPPHPAAPPGAGAFELERWQLTGRWEGPEPATPTT